MIGIYLFDMVTGSVVGTVSDWYTLAKYCQQEAVGTVSDWNILTRYCQQEVVGTVSVTMTVLYGDL